jgi:signal transduction histidine kinase/ActR/RegA family two-component response regulator
MNKRQLEQQTSLLYEIAMSIGNSLDLDVSLKEALTTLLRKLDGIGIGVFDQRKADKPIAQIPLRGQRACAKLVKEAIHVKSTSASVPHVLLIRALVNEHVYFFNLPNTGVLFLRRRKPLDAVTIKVLNRLCAKLDQSIQACFATQELNRKERELQNSLAQLQKAQEYKDKFLATVAHEIRTPLNGVVGFIEQLGETDLNETQRHYLDVINHSSDSLMGIINDTLDFSKIDSGKLELDIHAMNLHEVLLPTIELFKCKASEKNILLATQIDAGLSQGVLSDSLRLKQVISNLVSNAIKFTDQGRVDFTMAMVEENQDGLRVRFSVCDTGIGIDSASLNGIFDPFLQAEKATARRFGGTGLGLAISYQLVKKLGGTLSVTSEPGQGSEFVFELTFEKSEMPQAPEETVVETDAFKGRKILVAEDNQVNQMLVSAILKSINADFTICNNGAEALHEFERETFDLVLMDINMPVMDGLQSLDLMREFERSHAKPKTPIIALTANALVGDREKYIEHGMDDCLAKPLRKAELFHVFEAFLADGVREISD